MSSALLGLPFLQAWKIARQSGLAPYRVLVTSPPSAGTGEGGLRLLHVRFEPETEGQSEAGARKRVWILAYTGYERFRRPTVTE